MDIALATIEDAAEILVLQRLAYQSEAALYGGIAIPPLTQTLEDLKADFSRQTIFKSVVDGELVGSVRAREDEGTCHIGRLIVHPDHQRQGIGSALMDGIEGRFPDAARFELFTGHRSAGNLRLYQRLGHEIVRRENVSGSLELVYMEKRRGG